MITRLLWAGVGLVAHGTQRLLDIDCAASICEQECTQCGMIGEDSVEDCLQKIPQGCSVLATIAQTDVAPLYTCFRSHMGRGIALPLLTVNPEASLVLVKIDHFRSCSAAASTSFSMQGGLLSKQEMKTCSLGSNEDTEPLPFTGVDSVYVDLSHAVMQGADIEYIKILDSCAHEEDRISIAMLIETGELQGLGPPIEGSAIDQFKDVVFSCPALGSIGSFAHLDVCLKSIETRTAHTPLDTAGHVIGGVPLHNVFWRIRQLVIIGLMCGMGYITYLYGIALKKELERSKAAREVVRENFYQKEK